MQKFNKTGMFDEKKLSTFWILRSCLAKEVVLFFMASWFWDSTPNFSFKMKTQLLANSSLLVLVFNSLCNATMNSGLFKKVWIVKVNVEKSYLYTFPSNRCRLNPQAGHLKLTKAFLRVPVKASPFVHHFV